MISKNFTKLIKLMNKLRMDENTITNNAVMFDRFL